MTQIKLRRDTSAAFASSNPILGNGEPAYETDTKKLKIGDGTTAYTSLAYFAGGGGSAEFNVVQPLKLVDGTLTLQIDEQTIQVQNGKLVANLDELGNEVNDLSGRVTAAEADILTKQDKISFQSPLVYTEGTEAPVVIPESNLVNTDGVITNPTTASTNNVVRIDVSKLKLNPKEDWSLGVSYTSKKTSASGDNAGFLQVLGKNASGGNVTLVHMWYGGSHPRIGSNTVAAADIEIMETYSDYSIEKIGDNIRTTGRNTATTTTNIASSGAYDDAVVITEINFTLAQDLFNSINLPDTYIAQGPRTVYLWGTASAPANVQMKFGNGIMMNMAGQLVLQYPIETMTKEDYNDITPTENTIYMIQGTGGSTGGITKEEVIKLIGNPQSTANRTLITQTLTEGQVIVMPNSGLLVGYYGNSAHVGTATLYLSKVDANNKRFPALFSTQVIGDGNNCTTCQVYKGDRIMFHIGNAQLSDPGRDPDYGIYLFKSEDL
nr:MAG TPA: hyaluronidase [Caudoviricetes sp.]